MKPLTQLQQRRLAEINEMRKEMRRLDATLARLEMLTHRHLA